MKLKSPDNEWTKACNPRAGYWLCVVSHCASHTSQLVRVHDPFEKLLVRPFTKMQVVNTVGEACLCGHAARRQVGGLLIESAYMMEVGEM